jgi:hypothetical protein
LDGVFCAHREEFLDKFEKLFNANIRKVEDVNNLRGLVMAETADLEEIKDEIIKLYDKHNNIKKDEIKIPELPPTPTPLLLDLPTESSEIKPACGRKNPKDGFKRGFTYKPNSDTQNWATVVLPPYITTESCTFAGLDARNKGTIGGENGTEKRAVHILDRWTGQKLKEKHGSIIIRCGCYFWSIPNPSIRYD